LIANKFALDLDTCGFGAILDLELNGSAGEAGETPAPSIAAEENQKADLQWAQMIGVRKWTSTKRWPALAVALGTAGAATTLGVSGVAAPCTAIELDADQVGRRGGRLGAA